MYHDKYIFPSIYTIFPQPYMLTTHFVLHVFTRMLAFLHFLSCCCLHPVIINNMSFYLYTLYCEILYMQTGNKKQQQKTQQQQKFVLTLFEIFSSRCVL